jgi:hypothetical protein
MTTRYAPTRRHFLKAAVAVGGSAGLSACLDLGSNESIPTGVDDPSTLPRRQHAWNDVLDTDEHGNHALPKHHVFLYIDLDADGEPTDADRQQVEDALSALDRAYERSPAGLIFSIGYSRSYFERYGAAPEGVDLPSPRALSNFEDPEFDTQDMLLHLSSDRADVVMEADEALFGEQETVNGIEAVSFPGTVGSRRTGFIAPGMPAEKQDEVDGIPEDVAVPEASKLFMGFNAGFSGNQASEAFITIDEGPFAGGTTKHVSNLHQRLGRWYGDNDHDSMVKKLFGTHQVGDVEGVGDNVGDHSGVVAEDLEALVEEAREHGAVGHAQKMARANRDEEGNVLTLRRHVESTDEGIASLHFPSLQQGISTFEAVREAMNAADVSEETPAIRQRVNNGILRYIFVKHRGNFLVPPRELRVLPTPDGEAL